MLKRQRSSLHAIHGSVGAILGVDVSDDRCEVTVDFFVVTSCEEDCIPMGACVELDRDTIAAVCHTHDITYEDTVIAV